MDGHSFDESEATTIEALYTTDAAARRRAFVRELLGPTGDERVLSVGCGPGFEPAELAEVAGRVNAVDRSEAMLALARERCGDDRVSLERGVATDLPLADGAVDAAVSVQVLEYVEDVPGALAELARVLRPGGRAVLYATDWDSLVWASDDRERTYRVAAAYEGHCAHPHLGSRLQGPLRDSPLNLDRVEPFTICNTTLADSFAGHLREAVQEFVAARDDPATARAWAADLDDREAAGETLFSLTAYGHLVTKPA